jgi:hypothetical protein
MSAAKLSLQAHFALVKFNLSWLSVAVRRHSSAASRASTKTYTTPTFYHLAHYFNFQRELSLPPFHVDCRSLQNTSTLYHPSSRRTTTGGDDPNQAYKLSFNTLTSCLQSQTTLRRGTRSISSMLHSLITTRIGPVADKVVAMPLAPRRKR